MNRRPLHLCLVTYRFPPQAGGGVIRPLKFVKFLTREGIRVTVLTVADPSLRGEDSTLARDVPDCVSVQRVSERGAMAAIGRARRARRTSDPIDRLRVSARWWLHQWTVPDAQAGFIASAGRAAARPPVAEADLVLATGGPWSSFLAGETISRSLRVPLVLDYRDPWTTAPAGWPYHPGYRARRLNPGIERRLLLKAAAVTVAHESLIDLLGSGLRVPEVAGKCHWIPNGYDPEDFAGLTAAPSDHFVLTYVGSLYGGRTLQPIVDAIERIDRDEPARAARIRLRIVGPEGPRFLAEIASSPIADRVEATGHQPHRQALIHLLSSTVNVLTEIEYAGTNLHTAGKVYEYLRAGRPILALTGEGVTGELICKSGAGWVVPPSDSTGIRGTLSRAISDWEEGRPLPIADPKEVAPYDRSISVGRLASILRAVGGR